MQIGELMRLRNSSLVSLAFVLVTACGDGGDEGEASPTPSPLAPATTSPVEVMDPTPTPTPTPATADIASFLKSAANWQFLADSTPHSAGFGPSTVAKPYCVAWKLDYKDLVLEVSKFECSIRDSTGVLSGSVATCGYVSTCSVVDGGTYTLVMRAKGASDWTALTTLALTAASAPTGGGGMAPVGGTSGNTSGESGTNGPITCATIEGSTLEAADGVPLGLLTSNRFNANSIMNEFGTYGNKFASGSIWNEFGTYGGSYSSKSPWNAYASQPPLILKNGAPLCYMTVNTTKANSCNTTAVISCLR
jgi:hypothetical protein